MSARNIGRFFLALGGPTSKFFCLTVYNRCVYYGYMKTVLNVKTDPEIKEGAQRIAKEMGIPLSIVVNAYLKEFIRERKFTASLEPQLKKEVWDEMEQAMADYKQKKNFSPVFSDVSGLMKWLKS